MRHLTTFFYSTILACLSVIEWLLQVQKERPRSQNNCPITLFTRTFSFSLHHHWVVRHFGRLSNRQIVCWFCLTYFPIVPEGKTLPRWVFLQKTAVSALSKRMLPSCKNCALHVQSRSLQVKVIGLFILLAEFRAVMIKTGKYHVVTYFTSVKVWNTFKIAYWYRSRLCTNVFTFYH